MYPFVFALLNTLLAIGDSTAFVNTTAKNIAAHTLSGHAQGTTWQLTYYNEIEKINKRDIDSIFESIDSSLSIYKPYSRIVQFNNSRRGVIADVHLKKVVQHSLTTSRETNYLSDITVGPLTELWGFGAKETTSAPSKKELKKALRCVGAKYIKLSGDSLIKLLPCVRIDVNGIAQGYTVDVIAAYLKSKGITDYIVEVGGEIVSSGVKQPNRDLEEALPTRDRGNQRFSADSSRTPGEKFRVGIAAPSGDNFTTPPMQKIVELHNGALTTSGNYRKYHESGGKRYSHIIDPRTGMSTNSNVISVTVFARDATTADAFDNALMLMSVNDAIAFVEKKPEMAAFIIYRKPGGAIADTASSRFNNLIKSNN